MSFSTIGLGGAVERDTGGPKPSRPAPGGVQIKHNKTGGGVSYMLS